MISNHHKKTNRSSFFAALALLLTLCISATALIWLHTNRNQQPAPLQADVVEHISQIHAKVALQQRELWELRARVHNLEKLLQDKLTTSGH